MTQFPEHATGKPSKDQRVQKIARVAKACNVLIHIDGIPYGSTKTKVDNTEAIKKYLPEESIVETTTENKTETNEPPKRRGRPKKGS